MIMRGTTPYHSFILPMHADEITEIYVSYTQNGQMILDKTSTDAEIHDIVDLYENASMEELTEEVHFLKEAVFTHTDNRIAKARFKKAMRAQRREKRGLPVFMRFLRVRS